MAKLENLEKKAKAVLKEAVRDYLKNNNPYLKDCDTDIYETVEEMVKEKWEDAYSLDMLPDTENLKEDTVFFNYTICSWYESYMTVSLNELNYRLYSHSLPETMDSVIEQVMEDNEISKEEAEKGFYEDTYCENYECVVWASVSFDEFFEVLYKKLGTETPAINALMGYAGSLTDFPYDINNLQLTAENNVIDEDGLKDARKLIRTLEKMKDEYYLDEVLIDYEAS